MLHVQATTEEASGDYTLEDDISFIPEGLINIKADGAELVWIKSRFSTTFGVKESGGERTVSIYNIPMIEAAEQMYWKGDIAKTILINLW